MEAVSVRLLTPQQLNNMAEDLNEQNVLDVGEISEIDGFDDFNESYTAPNIYYSKEGTEAIKLTGGPPPPARAPPCPRPRGPAFKSPSCACHRPLLPAARLPHRRPSQQ